MKWFALIVLALLVALTLFCMVMRLTYGPSGKDRSRDFNRRNGRWRVLYSDGQYSTPMCHDVASDYAEMFGGSVVPKSDYQQRAQAQKGQA